MGPLLLPNTKDSFTHDEIIMWGLTVFPEPVCAQAIKSLPCIMIGMAYFCTGVGFSYLAFFTLDKNASYKPASSNLLIDGGASLPVTSTGILSKLSKFIPFVMLRNISSSSSGGGGGTYGGGRSLSEKYNNLSVVTVSKCDGGNWCPFIASP